MNITSVLGVLIVSAVLCVLLSSYRPEIAALVAAAAGIFVFLWALGRIVPAFKGLLKTVGDYGLDTEYFKTAFCALGICYATRFVADLCRDMGQSALAAKAELAGKCTVFILSVPLLLSVLNIAAGLIGGV